MPEYQSLRRPTLSELRDELPVPRGWLRSGCAIAGLICALALALVYFEGSAIIGDIDDRRLARVKDLGAQILKSDAADATILAVPLTDGANPESVLKALTSRAKELGLSEPEQRKLGSAASLASAPDQPIQYIVDFCASPPALRLLSERPQLLVHAPCRLTLYTDQTGQLWIAAVDPERLLDGGRPVTKKLLLEARNFRDLLLDLMASASNAASQ